MGHSKTALYPSKESKRKPRDQKYPGQKRHQLAGRFISYFRLFGGGIREAFGGVWEGVCLSFPPQFF